jgi:hypothetical protein
MVHIVASDVPKLVHLATAAQAGGQAHRATLATPSHHEASRTAQMTPAEAARFGPEGPIRRGHTGPCNRTLH